MEQARAGQAVQTQHRAVATQPAAFTHTEYRDVVLFQELLQPLFARFAHMGRVGRRVQVVWIDLNGDQAETVECVRLDNWHVVGGPDRRACDVGSGTGSHVAEAAVQHSLAQRLQQVESLYFTQQTERISATNEHTVRAVQRGKWIRFPVQPQHRYAVRIERGLHLPRVPLVIRERIGDKHYLADQNEEVRDCGSCMLQVRAAGHRGIA